MPSQENRTREKEWREKLKVAQEEVAKERREEEALLRKKKAEEEASRLEEDEQAQRELVERTMERLNQRKKMKR